MRIGFFTNTYLPIPYGASTSVEYFRKGLEHLGHDVFVFAPRFSHYTDSNKRVIRYPAIQWTYKMHYPIAISLWPPMNRAIDDLQLDVIHSHQPFSIGKDGLRQARRVGVPLVFTHHCKYEDYVHYVPLISKRVIRWHVKRQATTFANRCDQVIAPSTEIQTMIRQRGVTKPVSVLPTGIDWNRYQSGHRKKIRSQYGIAADALCLLFIGRLEQEKNLLFMVKSVASILQKRPDVKLLIVGGGSEQIALERLALELGIEKQVIFTGMVLQETIEHYFAAGDIFVQPSMTETQGLNTTEAMASGLPVVAVYGTGSNDQVLPGKTGMLVEADEFQFCAAAKLLIDKPDLRKQIGEAARQEAKQYDYIANARTLEGIYRKLVDPVSHD